MQLKEVEKRCEGKIALLSRRHDRQKEADGPEKNNLNSGVAYFCWWPWQQDWTRMEVFK